MILAALKEAKKILEERSKHISIEEARDLMPGQIIYHRRNKNKDGTAQRWKVNGAVKTWVRNPNRIKVPLKFGMYDYGYLTELNISEFTITPPESERVV